MGEATCSYIGKRRRIRPAGSITAVMPSLVERMRNRRVLNCAHTGNQQMLFARFRVAEIGVIGKIHQYIRALLGKLPHQIRKGGTRNK